MPWRWSIIKILSSALTWSHVGDKYQRVAQAMRIQSPDLRVAGVQTGNGVL